MDAERQGDNRGQDGQRQSGINSEEQDDGANERNQLGREFLCQGRYKCIHILDVAGDANHQFAALPLVEKAHG